METFRLLSPYIMFSAMVRSKSTGSWETIPSWPRMWSTLRLSISRPSRVCEKKIWKKESAWQQNLTSENAGHGRTPIYPIKINLCEQVKPNYFKKQRSSSSFLKFSFSEKATKICAICLMVLTFTKGQIMSESILRNHRFSKIPPKNLIDFCPGRLYRLGMLVWVNMYCI